MDSNFFLIGFSMFCFILWIRGCQFHWITSGFSFHLIHPFKNHNNESMSISPDWSRRWEDSCYTFAAYVSIMPNICHRYPWQKWYPTFHRASTPSSMVQLVGVLSWQFQADTVSRCWDLDFLNHGSIIIVGHYFSYSILEKWWGILLDNYRS